MVALQDTQIVVDNHPARAAHHEAKKAPVEATVSRVAQPAGPNKLFTDLDATYGDWRDDLLRDGFVVVKGAIPKERAEKYQDDMLSYLENL